MTASLAAGEQASIDVALAVVSSEVDGVFA